VKKLYVLAFVSALTLVACGDSGGTNAVTINGADFTVADINAMFVPPAEPLTKPQFAGNIAFYIQTTVIPDAAKEKWGIEVTAEEIEAEAQAVYEEFAPAEQTREQWLEAAGVTEAYLQRFAHIRLVDALITANILAGIERVEPELSEEDFEAGRRIFGEVCASHILATDLRGVSADDLEEAKAEAKAQAEDLIARIQAGESFEDLAIEYGKDDTAQSGGDLGCRAPSVPEGTQGGYVLPFAQALMVAPLGEVVAEPVETQFGFHVLLVRERDVPTDEEIIKLYSDLEINDEMNLQAQAFVLEALTAAEVTVNERFGTWVTSPAPQVIPPEA